MIYNILSKYIIELSQSTRLIVQKNLRRTYDALGATVM